MLTIILNHFDVQQISGGCWLDSFDHLYDFSIQAKEKFYATVIKKIYDSVDHHGSSFSSS